MTATAYKRRAILLGLVTLLFVLAAAPACSFAATVHPSDMTDHSSHGCDTEPSNPGECPRASEMHPDATVAAGAPAVFTASASPVATPPSGAAMPTPIAASPHVARLDRIAPLRI